MIKPISIFIALLVTISVSAGCVRHTAEPQRPAVAVIPKGTTDEFWKAIHAGAVKAGRELGFDIIWQGPIRSDDRSAQIDVVESMIVRGVKGIVLAPNDNTALRAGVEDAHRSGIPVVIVDSGLNCDKQVSFIATNNYKGGVMAGECLAKLLGGKGRVAMLRNIEGNESTENRERGFLDAIKKYPDISLVSSNQHGGGMSEAAYKASENILAPLKKGDSLALDGIFCSCEYTVFGMLRALQDGGLAGKVKFVGFDASKKINEALLHGDIDALVVQNPMKMGYLGVYAISDVTHGKQVAKQVDVDATLVTKANYNDAAIQELVNPPIKELLQ
jgi:ribose transport system substrate-binding protein